MPMTDPWCACIYANIKGVFVDGIHGAPYIAAPWILWDGLMTNVQYLRRWREGKGRYLLRQRP